MNNWNQQPANNQPGKDGTPPRTGGLLSNYARQRQPGPDSPISQPASGVPPRSPMPPGPSLPVPQQGFQPSRSGLLSSQHPGFVANTMQMVRGWSGKVAALAGHTVRPPEPPLERYHYPASSDPAMPLVARPQRWKRSRTVRIVRQIRGRRERWQRTQLTAVRVFSILGIILALLIVISSASGSAYGYTYYQNELPQVQRLANLQVPQTTRIYDRNGVLLYNAYDPNAGRSTPVSYNNIPKVLQDALTSTEDHTFWTNPGIDPLGIVRAASQSYGGASGITQQVVKNLSGNKQETLDRKISEAAIAIGMTQQYPKWKILEMYFNISPWGAQELGVEAATEDYFGLMPETINGKYVPGVARLDYVSDQDPHDALMELARASLLAGIPNQPSSYDPTLSPTNKQAALARQDHVLNLMMSFGVAYTAKGDLITPSVIKQAEALTAKMTFTPYQQFKKSPHFVDYVINEMETSLGNGDQNAGIEPFLTGGFNIRTTIDSNLEQYVENAVDRHLNQPEFQQFPYAHTATLSDNGPYGQHVNDAAVVVMNSKTGEILAMDGSANYNSTDPRVGGSVNATTYGIGRQPGSSFKPIVYATAMQMGWYPGIVLPDTETYFPNGLSAGAPVPTSLAQAAENLNGYAYTPTDYGNGFHPNISPMTLRLATANSFNVPAVKALQFIGTENAVVTAERMGLGDALKNTAQHLQNTCKDLTPAGLGSCFGMSLVLGTAEVPLLSLTGAYQVFADNGSRVPPQSILDITDNYGHTLYHFDPNNVQATQVFSPQVAYMMTSVLVDEYARRYEFTGDHELSFYDRYPICAYNYQQCPYQVAAKTGTSSNFVDNVTMGYTPNVVVGVWAGNANGDPMQNVVGITGAAPIWHSVMEFASNGWCNQDTDQVPCTNVNRSTLGIGQQNTFTPPSGLSQVCTNATTGLMGCSSYDWMPTGQDPQQSGVVTPPNTNNKGGNNNNNQGN